MTLNTRSHAAYRLNYHVILVIKYRHKFLTPEMLERMESITREVLNKWGVTLVEFNGEADHVHWLTDAHPALDLSRMIGNVKTVTARHLRKEYATHLARYFWKPYFWSRAYGIVSTGGAPLETVRAYIQNQEPPAELATHSKN